MKLHARYFAVRRAALQLDAALATVTVQEELTAGEVVRLLAELQGRYAAHIVRVERHGSTDKKADEA